MSKNCLENGNYSPYFHRVVETLVELFENKIWDKETPLSANHGKSIPDVILRKHTDISNDNAIIFRCLFKGLIALVTNPAWPQKQLVMTTSTRSI